jgi:nucleotide-binding universal stress UspA family protein
LHVADVIAATAAQFYPDSSGDPEAKTIASTIAHLRDVLASLDAGPATAVTVRLSPTPAHEIINFAEEIRADVIVVGTHGRSGVPRLLMGSVAEDVVRSAPCPVLVVHKNEHEFVLPDPVSAWTRI